MTHPKKELTVACSYLLRLMKAQVQLSSEQINTFKRTFHDVLSKRYVGHWFPDPGEVAVCFGDEGTWCPLYKHDIDGQVHQEYSDGEETLSSLSSDEDLASVTQTVKTLNLDEHKPTPYTKPTMDSRSSSSLASSSRASSPCLNAVSTSGYAPQPTMHEYNYSGSTNYASQPMPNEQTSQLWPQPLTMSDNFFSHQFREQY